MQTSSIQYYRPGGKYFAGDCMPFAHAGRYHLLSASGLFPPRLTGLWTGDWDTAWSGAFTNDANVNLQTASAAAAIAPDAVKLKIRPATARPACFISSSCCYEISAGERPPQDAELVPAEHVFDVARFYTTPGQ
jgi:hypothetical protein